MVKTTQRLLSDESQPQPSNILDGARATSPVTILFSSILVYTLVTFSLGDLAMAWDSKGFVKPSSEELKKKLTDIQYSVTQKDDTEKPFKNEYWDNHAEGLYVDVVSGEPLFSSKDKYDSGTGWPSFTQPLVNDNITTKTDRKLFVKRTEVRSKHANSHLGHVFDDGPQPTGKRYCMNSASLKFIPVADLEKAGYGEFKKHFNPEVKK